MLPLDAMLANQLQATRTTFSQKTNAILNSLYNKQNMRDALEALQHQNIM